MVGSVIGQWTSILRDAHSLKKYTKDVLALDSSLGSFLSFNPPDKPDWFDGRLAGLPVAVKDNIAVRGMPLTCGSRILENFQAPYTATAIEKLQQNGAVIVGKTNMDEFGMGSSTENSALGKTVNPWDVDRVAGGSSGGSATAVAAGLVPLAIGSDTGGSVRQPANFCGIYGLKPTYGSISRYGLTAYASSLEVIGAMSTDLELLKLAFQLMCSIDKNDQTTVEGNLSDSPGGKRVAVLNVEAGTLDANVEKSYKMAEQCLQDRGYELTGIDIPALEFVIPSYYTIATAEASANLARYNGMRYGNSPEFADNPVDLMRKARHEGFGPEVKLRILLGTYVLRSGFQDQYYGRAQKVRTLICREIESIYKKYDIILMPIFPTQAFCYGDSRMDNHQQRLADIFTSLANLIGLPALAIPTGVEGGLPTGVQLMAPAFGEDRLFKVAAELEGDFPIQKPDRFLDLGI